MRDITTAPIFIRLGKRQRAPEGTPVAKVIRIVIDNVVASGVHHEYSAIIAGLAESPVEDVRLSNIRIHYNGGGTKENAVREIPENEKNYPEPSMFGVTPAYGFYVRHVRGITFSDVEVSFEKDDARPAFFLDDVKNVAFVGANAELMPDAKMFVLRNVSDFSSSQSRNRDDVKITTAERREF
jgi:polygalacturonase